MAYDPKLGYSDPTQVQQNQIGFAPEVAPYAQRLLGRAESLFDEDYQQYQPERVAGFLLCSKCLMTMQR